VATPRGPKPGARASRVSTCPSRDDPNRASDAQKGETRPPKPGGRASALYLLIATLGLSISPMNNAERVDDRLTRTCTRNEAYI
jgi:hypothetical protein